MTKVTSSVSQIPFRVHPRVFSALGADLVTSDVIALIELVKNAYDAFATIVDVRFVGGDAQGPAHIEVQDDGEGMDRNLIENVWSVVATPYRRQHPVVKKGNRGRRVTGEKGLGRLSTARLGTKLEMFTQRRGKPCWKVDVDWGNIDSSAELASCVLSVSEYKGEVPWKSSGTVVRIFELRSDWQRKPEEEMEELRNQLARFLPPFEDKGDFQIQVTSPGQDAQPIRIERLKLVDNPPYRIAGTVDERGTLRFEYRYSFDGKKRSAKAERQLTVLPPPEEETAGKPSAEAATSCGPFKFEFRVWDLDKDVLLKLSERFGYAGKAQDLRTFFAKGPYAGVSLYRDGVIVLPKTDAASDWLKLNLRRVSRVGTRLSSNQFIGYIEISSVDNSALRDTSDRERLVDNHASRQFELFVYEIVGELEDQRTRDKEEAGHKEPPFADLLSELKDETFAKTITDLAERDASWDEVKQATREHERTLEKTISKIETRLVYYSRLASLGTLAGLLQHEVGNHTVAIDEFLQRAEKFLQQVGRTAQPLMKRLETAGNSLRSLQRLSDVFSPLASQSSTTRRRRCTLEDSLRSVRDMYEKELLKSGISLEFTEGHTAVAVDPGEVIAIFTNLINNAIYWLARSGSKNRKILVEFRKDTGAGRVQVRVHDSGPGVEPGFEERIFYPGVTRKPNGLGMGLTVSSELVAQYGGRMALAQPGALDGASFGFDLPLVREKS